MRFLVITNGEYGDLNWYRDKSGNFDKIICVDGGTRRARELCIVPDWVVGDMDSISKGDRKFMEQAGVCFEVYPAEKDYTDTQLALELAEKQGSKEIVVWGGTGSRLDHNLSNIFSAASFLTRGINIVFESRDLMVYLMKDRLVLPGSPGDTVSLIALGAKAEGVYLQGFKYPLNGVTLEGKWQWAVSNVIMESNPVVTVNSGILAVLHYQTPLP